MPTLLLPLLLLCTPPDEAPRKETGREHAQELPWVVYEPAADSAAPGRGKHIVLIAGDEEYRSEEALPMLGRMLAEHHGFRCTVLFSTDPETGAIDPENQTHISGMSHLGDADLAILFLRFRELPDEDMRHLVDFVESGKPVIGLRTSTHAFDYRRNTDSPFAHWSWRNDKWPGGFGSQILGETWVAHHGHHGRESTRGVVEAKNAEHPVLRGVDDVWGPTDVYTVRELPDDATVLLLGQVLEGMQPGDGPVVGPKNEPMLPLAWVREIKRETGPAQRVFCTTMGAATDCASAGLRRLIVNACYWGMRLEKSIPERAVVEIPDTYAPTPFGFGKQRRGVMPSEHAP